MTTSQHRIQRTVTTTALDIVFRIYDSCLANGIEAIFGFSVQLLRKNEALLLKLKFDEILSFLNKKLLDLYEVRSH